jgi:hypothetical protein
VGIAAIATGLSIVMVSKDPGEPTMSATASPGGVSLRVKW